MNDKTPATPNEAEQAAARRNPLVGNYATEGYSHLMEKRAEFVAGWNAHARRESERTAACEPDSDSRTQILRLIRERPSCRDDDPGDDEYWETPLSIAQRYYDGGQEINAARLVDRILASEWLTARERALEQRGAREALRRAARSAEIAGTEGGWQFADALMRQAEQYRDEKVHR